MNGWKTKLGAVSFILTGIAILLEGFVTEGFQGLLKAGPKGMASIATGVTAWGIGHKLEKGPVKNKG